MRVRKAGEGVEERQRDSLGSERRGGVGKRGQGKRRERERDSTRTFFLHIRHSVTFRNCVKAAVCSGVRAIPLPLGIPRRHSPRNRSPSWGTPYCVSMLRVGCGKQPKDSRSEAIREQA